MENFSHFLITRFNLNLYERDKHAAPTRTARWLEHRFEVAVPVRRRHARTLPPPHRVLPRRVSPLRGGVLYGRPDGVSDRKPAQYDPLGSRGGTRLHPPPHGLLITTNLDNDDALASDALELLRREIRPCPGKRIYSLLYGYQYFTSERFLLKMRYTNNHFLTLVEPFDDRAETIIAYRHTRAIRQQPTVYISSPHGKWLEIVHEDNVSNDLRINAKVRNIPVLRGRTFSDFGLPELRVTARRQWFQTLFLLPVRFLVTGAKRLRGKRARLRRK